MKKLKNNINAKPKRTSITVKTGTVEEFFTSVKSIMRSIDEGKPIKKKGTTLTFVEPAEMLHFLSKSKMKLINSIRNHPDTITNIAKVVKRNRASVYRDINELEKFGLVKSHEEINPGHGRHKIIELVSPVLKLEAYV